MQFNFEKIINVSVGVVLLTNLYLLSGIFGIPSDFIIILCLIICAFFFVINFNKQHFINLTNNWNTIFYILVSIPLCFIDWIINDSTPKLNDSIRVLMYCFYFSWTYSFYNDFEKLKKWFINISFTSFIILTIQGLFENSNPILFSFLLSGSNLEKRLLSRIGGTLIDPNSYSGVLSMLLIVIYVEWYKQTSTLKTFIIIILCITTFYLNDLAGSRQGLIMILVFMVYLFFKKVNALKIIFLVSTIAVTSFIILLSWNQITTFIENNPASSISRFVAGENSAQSSQSNIDRTNSLWSGINLCIDNYFLYGPGIFNFASRWAKFTTHHEPHNGLFFIFTQFGIFGFIPLFVMYKLAKRSIEVGVFVFFIVFFVHYSLQPNLMYYCTAFFAAFYIDYKYFLAENTE